MRVRPSGKKEVKKGFGRMTTRLLASSNIVIDYCYSAASAGSFYGHMANHAFILLIAILTANSLSNLLSPTFDFFWLQCPTRSPQ